MWSATTAPGGDSPAFALVSLGVEPPAGIEPATPSLPCISGSPSCEPAFLQVAADRRMSSYVLCRDGRQAQLLADPSPTMTPTPGGRARDATSSQGIVPDSSPPRRHGANGAHRPGPGPAALHPPPHPTDPACSRPEVAPAAHPGRAGTCPDAARTATTTPTRAVCAPSPPCPKSLLQAHSPSRRQQARDCRPRSAHRWNQPNSGRLRGDGG
jgi:hypothetical protein